MSSFEVGELVWAKIGRYPWWPSIVVSEEDVSEEVRKQKKKNCSLVRFFADTQFGWMKNHKSELRPLRGPHFQEFSKVKNTGVKKALEEALAIEKELGIVPTESEEEAIEGEVKNNTESNKRKAADNGTAPKKKIKVIKDQKKKKDEDFAPSEETESRERKKELNGKQKNQKENKNKIEGDKKKEHKESKKQKKEKKDKKKRIEATLGDISDIKTQIQQAIMAHSASEVVNNLKRLQAFNVSLEILAETKIGKTIKKLSKYNNEQVAKQAQTLVKRYEKVMHKYVKKGGDQMLPLPTQEQKEIDATATPQEDTSLHQTQNSITMDGNSEIANEQAILQEVNTTGQQENKEEIID